MTKLALMAMIAAAVVLASCGGQSPGLFADPPSTLQSAAPGAGT